MKKLILLTVFAGMLPVAIQAQDDDLYFTPKKGAERVNTQQSVPQSQDAPAYYGSSRDVDEYNRRPMHSTYEVIGTDSLGNDIIEFHSGAEDSTKIFKAPEYDDESDYAYSRRMSRFDDFYWYDPWFDGYYGFYGYSPYRLSRWGWYPGWYAGYYSWYDPFWYDWYYPYYGYRPWYSGWYGGWYGGSYYHNYGSYHPRGNTGRGIAGRGTGSRGGGHNGYGTGRRTTGSNVGNNGNGNYTPRRSTSSTPSYGGGSRSGSSGGSFGGSSGGSRGGGGGSFGGGSRSGGGGGGHFGGRR